MAMKAAAFTNEGIDLSSAYSTRLSSTGACTPEIEEVYVTDETHYDTLIYGGTITIDYKNGVSCFGSNEMRKGKVTIDFTYIVSFVGDTTYSTQETIRFVNFTRNSVIINGTIKSASKSEQPASLQADGVQLTYADNSVATWHGELLYDSHTSPGNIVVRGGVEGVTRKGLYFNADITSGLTFPLACSKGEPTSGTVDVKVNQAATTVDYGNGACDDTYQLASFRQLQ